MRGPLDHARRLLLRASHDLIAAELAAEDGRLPDIVCFHSQQAVEKSLKAVLAAREVVYPRTHDIGLLLQLAGPLFEPARPLAAGLTALTRFATDLRYGEGPEPEPSAEDANSALELARKVYHAVQQMIDVSDPPPGSGAPNSAPDSAT